MFWFKGTTESKLKKDEKNFTASKPNLYLTTVPGLSTQIIIIKTLLIQKDSTSTSLGRDR